MLDYFVTGCFNSEVSSIELEDVSASGGTTIAKLAFVKDSASGTSVATDLAPCDKRVFSAMPPTDKPASVAIVPPIIAM
jgi:hypothetical protein